MKRETYFRDTNALDDPSDESDDGSDPGLNAPKRSPMRRKEKFRVKDFKVDNDLKDRKRKKRQKHKYDFKFWEE